MPSIPGSSDRSFSSVVRINGQSSTAFMGCIRTITVDEDLDVGSSCTIELQACRNDDGSWPYLEDDDLQVWNRVTVSAAFPKQSDVVFDGYISHVNCRTNEEEANMTVEIRGVDASYHMNQEEKARIWRGKTYEAIATEIFDSYQFHPVVADAPSGDEAPAQVAQRATDHRFVRELARRRGYEFYVMGGNAYFRPAPLSAQPQKLIATNFGDQTNCYHLQFESDGTAPTVAHVPYFDAMEGKAAGVKATGSELDALGTQDLSALRGPVGMPQTTRLSRGLRFASDAQASSYASGMLRRHGWWITVRGTLDGLRYGAVLRSRKPVTIKGVGHRYNGVYYVRKVQHRLTLRSYDMQFEATRNALGLTGSEDFEGESPDTSMPAALGPGIDFDAIEVVVDGPRVLPA